MDADYDAAIEAWAKGAWQTSREMLPPVDTGVTDDLAPTLTYSCEIINFSGAQSHKIPHTPLDEQAQKMSIMRNDELLAKEAMRSTRHIEIKLPENSVYQAGDHLGVVPENSGETVELAASLCSVRLTDMVVIQSLQEQNLAEKLPIGLPISVKDLFTGYVDLVGPVTRKELRLLAQSCPCPPEKKAILELAGSQFQEEIIAKERTFLELCQQFRSVPCTLELLLSARPVLKPRYYSISSSPLAMKDSCSLTVGVLQHSTTTNRLLKGVCSNYLATIPQNGALQCFVKDTKSHFRLPENPAQDIILIGPGTGLAPLRGFLQERKKQKENGVRIGRQLLFFGCRNPDQDYIYRNELEEYEKSGLLQGLFVAFSRQPGLPKCYVQDSLRKNAPLVWEYVQNNARILLCGDGKSMAPCVRTALKSIYESEGKLSADAAEQLFKEKQDSYLYVEDVWAG